ncbi:hypothetical protein IWW47_000033 [Coemansia sp. RSA 2052]|nr:hypothetical protein IWW47_000033 [Coemansia sp. RSA 2052]
MSKSRKTSRRLAALSPAGRSTSPPSQIDNKDQTQARSSFTSTRSGLSNFDSLRTHTTEFYSASSQLSATSFHTADNEPSPTALEAGLLPSSSPILEPLAMSHHTINSGNSTQMSRSTAGRAAPFTQLADDENDDGDFAIAMARQYVLDAEAAGSASPSHRSRKGTDVSRMLTDRSLGADVATAPSEDYPPQVPPLRHMQGNDRDDDDASDGHHHHELTPESPAVYGDSGRALSERLRDEEVEDDANEARHFVSTRMRYPPPKYHVKSDSSIPVGAVLFLFGFLLLPLWWIGAVFPRSSEEDVVRSWRKYNALMTLVSLPLLGLFLALGGWHSTHN